LFGFKTQLESQILQFHSRFDPDLMALGLQRCSVPYGESKSILFTKNILSGLEKQE